MSATAILLAGQRPGSDPLAAHFGGTMKALVPLAGEPMVRRPAAALLASPAVGQVIVLAQQVRPLAETLAGLDVAVRESRGTISETLLGLCADPATPWPLLVTTADHALLDPATVAEFCAAAERLDIAVGVVQRARLDERLPNSRRTWHGFAGEQVTGANLFWLASPEAARAIELWRSVEQDRKKAWRLIALLGPFWLLMAALRLARLDDLALRLSDRLGLGIGFVRLTNPLAGVDVDSLADHVLVEQILRGKA